MITRLGERAFRLVWFMALLGILLPRATAQLSNLLPKSESAASAKPLTLTQRADKLKSIQADARSELAKLDDSEGAPTLPAGISADDLAARRQTLDQIIRGVSRALTYFDAIPNEKKALETAREAASSWSGFTDPPPYSWLMVDDLINRRDGSAKKASTYQSSISLLQRSLESLQKESSDLQDQTQKLVKENAANPDNAANAWRLEFAAESTKLIAVRTESLRVNIELLEVQVETAKSETGLLDRQATAAKKKATLSDEDIEKLRSSAQERAEALKKEAAAIRPRIKSVTAERAKAQSALDLLKAKNDPPAAQEDLDLAQAKVSSAETRTDALQFIADNLESLASVESFMPEIYVKRKAYLEEQNKTKREAILQDLRNARDRLSAWEMVSTNDLSAVNADLANQDSISAKENSGSERQKLATATRETLFEKQLLLQRLIQTTSYYRKNLSRWIDDFEDAARPTTWTSWISFSWEKFTRAVRRVWTHKLFEIPTTEIGPDGLKTTTSQGIELGLILSAAIFFIIAYMLSSRFSRRLQRVMVGRGRIAEAQANTLRNWLMILVGAVLALTTLHLLRIPLTVFAFFGGALAIGLGFGTQTLIKNFISGIIVLFERKIRVDDIVSVNSITGKILEVNTRSSVLRSADGVETIVPNSLFLENQISNLTLSNRLSRRVMKIGVSYESAPQVVSETLKECFDRHGLVLKDPPPQVIFDDFADSALIFTVYYWIEFNDKTDLNIVASDLRFMIWKRFSDLGISIPFPQRDLHLSAAEPLQFEWAKAQPPKQEPPPKANLP
ncbi:mechanosensitive ion channel [Luteolibacter pohnpeiensis]|uniref:Mechanosensitive ion channel n=1 Tax=Luteolibacter pohnpeiensis TaxID=454153 RepID=A0A934S903_9BACT|nr:mechanosensitive ion channel domain-containing protein [Luteolibacter pohnpeiensis]MBK1881892.1 mechanosensitive ion channel [Luteolibacter pohnpeiensis]